MSEPDDLHARWRQSDPEYADDYAEDGVIDEAKWGKAARKVLFLLKETNDFRGDLRSLFRDEWEGPKYTIWRNVARWSYGIQHTTVDGFPPMAEAEDRLADAFLSCAVMNLKKTSGKGAANEGILRRYAKKDAEYIREELALIDADVVVCGYTFDILRDALGYAVAPDDRDEYIYRIGSAVFISWWHPAAQFPAKMMYHALCSLFRRSLL